MTNIVLIGTTILSYNNSVNNTSYNNMVHMIFLFTILVGLHVTIISILSITRVIYYIIQFLYYIVFYFIVAIIPI